MLGCNSVMLVDGRLTGDLQLLDAGISVWLVFVRARFPASERMGSWSLDIGETPSIASVWNNFQ